MNLKDILERTAQRFPSKDAVFFEGNNITFDELNKAVNRFAAGLKEKIPIRKGDPVAILLKNSPKFLVSLYSILKIGAVAVPINIFLTPSEIKFILADCDVKAVITSSDFFQAIRSIKPELPGLERAVVVDDAGADEQFCLSHSRITEGASDENPPDDIHSEDDAIFLYTSGTTGKPKAAILTHKNFVSNIDSSRRHISVTPEDSFLLILPMFHSFSLTVNCLLPVYIGCKIVLLESIKPLEKVLDALLKQGPTIMAAVPAVYNVLARKELPAEILKMLRLRICISGSAPLAEATLRTFEKKFPIPLVEGYGLSEASPVVSLNPLEGVRKVGSIGVPLPDVEARIFDDNDNELPVGEPGELVVRGPNVMKGYFNRKEETKEALRSGWLHTGDIAKMDEDGYIFILDRKKDLIISKGMNVYPREIEELLYTYPKIADAAVVGKQDEKKNETPVAYVSLKEGEHADSKEIIEFLKPIIASYKIPREVIFIKDFPRTSTGKILKRDLKAI